MREDISVASKEKSLRRLAEELLRKRPGSDKALARQDLDYLLHELSVHQVELEMQNQELLEAQRSLVESQRRFSYLYHFAPVGYLTLDEEGKIREINLTACKQFGVQKRFLINLPLSLFVEREDRKHFAAHCRDVFSASDGRKYCELRLLKGRKKPFWAEIISRKIIDDSGDAFCLMVVSDISSRKAAEDAVLNVHHELESLAKRQAEELSTARLEAAGERNRRFDMEKKLSALQIQLRALSSYLNKSKEEERKGLARDIHDELGQMLVAIKMDVDWIKKEYSDHARLGERLSAVDETLGMSIRTVERLISELRPVLLDQLGLAAAVDWYVEQFQKRTGIRCELLFGDGKIDIKGEPATAIFRILQEALTNVARHAGARKVRITLRRSRGNLLLKVSDNGRGIAKGEIDSPGSFGIMGMRERVSGCGGTFRIKGEKDGGTTVTVTIPAGSADPNTSD